MLLGLCKGQCMENNIREFQYLIFEHRYFIQLCTNHYKLSVSYSGHPFRGRHASEFDMCLGCSFLCNVENKFLNVSPLNFVVIILSHKSLTNA